MTFYEFMKTAEKTLPESTELSDRLAEAIANAIDYFNVEGIHTLEDPEVEVQVSPGKKCATLSATADYKRFKVLIVPESW